MYLPVPDLKLTMQNNNSKNEMPSKLDVSKSIAILHVLVSCYEEDKDPVQKKKMKGL